MNYNVFVKIILRDGSILPVLCLDSSNLSVESVRNSYSVKYGSMSMSIPNSLEKKLIIKIPNKIYNTMRYKPNPALLTCDIRSIELEGQSEFIHVLDVNRIECVYEDSSDNTCWEVSLFMVHVKPNEKVSPIKMKEAIEEILHDKTDK